MPTSGRRRSPPQDSNYGISPKPCSRTRHRASPLAYITVPTGRPLRIDSALLVFPTVAVTVLPAMTQATLTVIQSQMMTSTSLQVLLPTGISMTLSQEQSLLPKDNALPRAVANVDWI